MNFQRFCISVIGLSLITFSVHACIPSVKHPPQLQENSNLANTHIDLLHFRPQAGIAGDAHPFFGDGKWYVYYLNEGYISNLVTTQDFLKWQEVPIQHTHRNSQNPELAPYYVLGVFKDEKEQVYRTYHGWSDGVMISHVSKDLVNWDFSLPKFNVPHQDRYSVQRDPYVFWNDEELAFWMLMTCEVKGQPAGTNGAICFASSKDLINWVLRGDLFFPGNIGAPEVPQMFTMGGRWFLTASLLKDGVVGRPSYWVSEHSIGPWKGDPLSLDGEDMSAANLGWDGQHMVLLGWIPLTDVTAHGTYTWGGHFAFPREVYALQDGNLGTRLYPGLEEKIRGELLANLTDHNWKVESGNWSSNLPMTYIGTEVGRLVLDKKFDRLDVDISFVTSADVHNVGVVLNPASGLGGVQIRIDRTNQRLLIESNDPFPRVFSQLELPEKIENFELRILVEADILEVFINDCYSLAARLPISLAGTQPSLWAEGGKVEFERADFYWLKTTTELR